MEPSGRDADGRAGGVSLPGRWTCRAGRADGLPAGGEPGWHFYVAVDDIDAAAARVVERGGTIEFGPMEIPGGDYSLSARDPQGARFGLVGPRK
ncbi:VOC family protein [Sphingomonas sp. LK11]|uniref:VOC family protein n=1 Tax=Sphingomonas sp. LK11 TaxID=1390395 RepID=UPI003002093B